MGQYALRHKFPCRKVLKWMADACMFNCASVVRSFKSSHSGCQILPMESTGAMERNRRNATFESSVMVCRKSVANGHLCIDLD